MLSVIPELQVMVNGTKILSVAHKGFLCRISVTGSNKTYLGKVKQSRNRPGVAQRVPGGLGSQIFMTFGK